MKYEKKGKGKSAHCENENGAISCIIFHAIKKENE